MSMTKWVNCDRCGCESNTGDAHHEGCAALVEGRLAPSYSAGLAEGAAAERARIAEELLHYTDRADEHSPSLYWEGWYDGVCEAYELVRSASSSAPVEGEKPEPLCCCNPMPLSPDSWCKAKDHSAALAAPTQGEKP